MINFVHTSAFWCQCRQEKDMEKFKTNNDVRKGTAMETR